MKADALLLAGILATSDHVMAAPRAEPQDVATPSSFSLPAIRNAAFKPHGPLALAKVYHKYGKALPDDLAGAVARFRNKNGKRSTGSASNSPEQYDAEYLTPVQIGSPAQTLPLDFDTGSSDLWVFSTETSSQDVGGQTLYSPTKSSTAKKLSGSTWEISYGDGSSSSGDVYTDVVAIGGLSVKGQAVESATKVSDTFSGDKASSGLLGLAFSSINTVQPQQQNTFFANTQSALDKPVFTVDLRHNADGKYNFGFIDSAAHSGSITYTAVDSSQGFWGFTSTGYAVGSGSLKEASIDGIADTGTTLLLLPDSIVTAYYKSVSGASYDNQQGGYTFSCDSTLPDFSFGVGSSSITVPGDYINFAPTGDGDTCFGGIQSDQGVGFSIFGDVALKAAFVVFDGGNEQLGWSQKAGSD